MDDSTMDPAAATVVQHQHEHQQSNSNDNQEQPQQQQESLGSDPQQQQQQQQLEEEEKEVVRQKPIPRDWIERLLSLYPNPHTTYPHRNKALVVAPMVDQSDLPFRLLCRRYGANLCFTPMIHARLFQVNRNYQRRFFNLIEGTPPEDRPLIAQLCGSQPVEFLVRTALQLQPHVDGIDLNCGCPQNIAKRGQYGSFLLEQPDVLVHVAKTVSAALDIPLSVKVRLLPSGVDDSLALYQRLVDEGGVSLITIHGRNRFQKGPLTGRADWDAIRRAVDLVGQRIPIFANGNIASLQDVQACLDHTKADGVMSSEAILEYPPLFQQQEEEGRRAVGRLELARQYLELARKYPPNEGGQGSGLKCLKIHLHRFLHADLQDSPSFRNAIIDSTSAADLLRALDDLEDLHRRVQHDPTQETLCWYVRHQRIVEHTTGKTAIQAKKEREGAVKCNELVDDAADCMAGLFVEQ